MKTCKKCNQELSLDNFRAVKNRYGKTYNRNICRTCENEEANIRMTLFYKNNTDKCKERCTIYQKNNRDKVNTWRKTWQKNREQTDINFKLHRRISATIRKAIINKYIPKIKSLPYTIDELKAHIESQFEPWMSWDNWSHYSDNKLTWQIDHIIPRSKLPYTSVLDNNFYKCWALENLRPISAIENLKKGSKYVAENDQRKVP